MELVETNGTSLACEQRGAGDPPFVFIHGWACDHSFWQPQFDDLSRDHRCVAIDLRGRGQSPPVPPYDAATAADDVAGVMAALELGPAILVGHSLGGLVALLVNERNPEYVLGTVLGDSPLTAAAEGRFPAMVEAIRAAGSMEPARAFVESFFRESTPAAVAAKARAVMLTCDFAVAAGMLDKAEVFAGRVDALLHTADQKPLMLFWSEHPLGDPAHVREVTVFARQEPLANSGHFFQLEQPEVTNALLHAFLDDVERDPRLALKK